jgi:multiple sugar transport system permease protein
MNKGNILKRFFWSWKTNYNVLKRKVTGGIGKFFDKITFKAKRTEKRLAQDQVIREYLGKEPDYDIYIFEDFDELRIRVDKEYEVLKESNDPTKIAYIRKVHKALPPIKKVIERRFKTKTTFRQWGKALLYLGPVLILLGIFTFYPIFNSFRLVVYTGYNASDGTIAGYTLIGNFVTVLTESNFLLPSSHTQSSVVINTLVIVFVSVPISVVISLIIAVALNSIKPLRNFFQTVFFLPYVTNTIAIGLVFAYMFKTDGGLVNNMLNALGIGSVNWIGPRAGYWNAMSVLLIYSVWDSMAFKIMVFLSAIQGIDKQYYQAAQIDATPKSRMFTKITVPMISPMVFYIVVTSIIGAFKTYSSVIAIFGDSGQPAGATYTLKTIVFYIYDYMNNSTPGNLSLAAASSIILFAIILMLTLVQMWVGKKRVHY